MNTMEETIEEFKQIVRETLEHNFINHKDEIDKEMTVFNIIVTSFSDAEQYTYDEFCKSKMKYEVEACDLLDVDFGDEELNHQEKMIIQNRALRKAASSKKDYEDIMLDEYVKWQLEKCYKVDKEIFYQINKHSCINLIKNKVGDVFEEKKSYFEEMANKRALKIAEQNARENQEKHEQDIRSSII